MPTLIRSRPAFCTLEAAGEVSDPGLHSVAFPQPARIDPPDMAARLAGHLEIMPFPKIANGDLVALMLKDPCHNENIYRTFFIGQWEIAMARPRGSKRLGLQTDELKEGCQKLQAAHDFLTKVTAAYPIDFEPTEPYGAAHEASKALAAVGKALTGDGELFSSQRLNPKAPFHRE